MITDKHLNLIRVIGFLGFFFGFVLLFIGVVGHSILILLSLALISIIHLIYGIRLIIINYKINSIYVLRGAAICLLGLCYIDILYFYVVEGLPESNFGYISGVSIILNLILLNWILIKKPNEKKPFSLSFNYRYSLIYTIIICSVFFFFKENYHVTSFFKDKAYYYQQESTQLINNKEYSKAKEYALRSLDMENIDKDTKALCYRNLGILYRKEGEIRKSDSLLDLSYYLMKSSSSSKKDYFLKDIKSHYFNFKQQEKNQITIDKFTQLIQEEPNNAEAYNELGAAYHKQGKYNLAIKNYTKAIQLKPNFVNAYGNRGISKNDLGDKKGAISDYNKAIELDSSYGIAYNNRGYTYKELGGLDQAIKDFQKAIELNPKIENAVGNLMMIYKELDDCEKVLEWCNYHRDHFPYRERIYQAKAACLVQLSISDSTNFEN